MNPNTGDHFTDMERAALAGGFARIHRGRVVPIIRGAEDDPPGDPPSDPPTDPPADPPKTFSQADVDRIVSERLARDRRERPSDDEVAQLRDKATKYDELEAANATELEKAQQRAEQAEQRAAQVEIEARETRLRAAVLAEAAKPDRKVVDTEQVIEALTGPKRELLELDDDGAPTNIAKAMDSLLEQRPNLVAQDGGDGGDPDQGVRPGGKEQLSAEALKSMTAEEIVQARREGRLTGLGVGS